MRNHVVCVATVALLGDSRHEWLRTAAKGLVFAQNSSGAPQVELLSFPAFNP